MITNDMRWLLGAELAFALVVLALIIYLIWDVFEERRIRQWEEFEDELEDLLDGR